MTRFMTLDELQKLLEDARAITQPKIDGSSLHAKIRDGSDLEVQIVNGKARVWIIRSGGLGGKYTAWAFETDPRNLAREIGNLLSRGTR